MTLLQAAMKDASAKKWRERRLIRKVGSVFKGCAHCGSHQVFRYDEPVAAGRTFWCWDCGAVDAQAWGDSWSEPRVDRRRRAQAAQPTARRSRADLSAYRLVGRFE